MIEDGRTIGELARNQDELLRLVREMQHDTKVEREFLRGRLDLITAINIRLEVAEENIKTLNDRAWGLVTIAVTAALSLIGSIAAWIKAGAR